MNTRTWPVLTYWHYDFCCKDASFCLASPQVKVSFHTSLELLTYQHLPEDQLPPGIQVLQLENGDKILEFKQELVIEYSNKATQVRTGTVEMHCSLGVVKPQMGWELSHTFEGWCRCNRPSLFNGG